MRFALLIIVLLLTACTQAPIKDEFTIATTFFPLTEITQHVAGNDAVVYSVVPPGVEPHDYEPTPKDIVQFNQADVFVTLGLEFEPIEEKLLDSRQSDPLIIRATSGVPLIHIEEDGHEEYDPHVWLSPQNMILMTKTVEESLTRAYPDKAELFHKNAQQYIDELEILHQEYSLGLYSCKQRTILVSHHAFGYLTSEYDLTQIAIGGLSPDAEPTSGQLKELVDTAKANNIKYVFYEEMVDPRIAETIAREVGAQTLELNPAEGSATDTYMRIMQRNLENLRIALECK